MVRHLPLAETGYDPPPAYVDAHYFVHRPRGGDGHVQVHEDDERCADKVSHASIQLLNQVAKNIFAINKNYESLTDYVVCDKQVQQALVDTEPYELEAAECQRAYQLAADTAIRAADAYEDADAVHPEGGHLQ